MPDFSNLFPSRAARAHKFSSDKDSFDSELLEIQLRGMLAQSLFDGGKITAREFDDFKGDLISKYIEALPPGDFHEMMQDGRLAELQAQAGHNGSRDAGDVDDARLEVRKKVEAEALDLAWLNQRISAEQYVDGMRGVVGDRNANDLMEDTNSDFDKAATEVFASRNDDSPLHADLQSYLDKTYGKDRPNREPEGRVVPNESIQPAKVVDVSKMSAAEALQARLDEAPKRPKESASPAPVKDRIIDHDAPDEEAA